MRWMIFAGLAAFAPLLYYLAVVGGVLPYGGMLLITLRNISNFSILMFGLAHLLPYGALLFWLAGVATRAIQRHARGHEWIAATVAFLLLAGLGAMPIYGVAHGHIHWTSAYALYVSDTLR